MNVTKTKRQSSLLSFWNQRSKKKSQKNALNRDKQGERRKEDKEVKYETSIYKGENVLKIKTEKIKEVIIDTKRFDFVATASKVSKDLIETDLTTAGQQKILSKAIEEDEKKDNPLHGTLLKSEFDDQEIKGKSNDNIGLSPYELMRIKRIKRNEEHLIKLGLLSPNGTSSIQESVNQNRKRRRKGVAKSSISSSHQGVHPTRRSTRIKRTTGTFIDDDMHYENEQKVDDTTNTKIKIENIKEEIQYQVSPIVEYAMDEKIKVASTLYRSTSLPGDETFSCPKSFSEAGPKLIPPAGLTAIYSLQFCPHYNEKSMLSCSETNLIVGAGKSGIISVWNWHLHSHSQTSCENNLSAADDRRHYVQPEIKQDSTDLSSSGIYPMLSWKGHKNRWISSAHFLPPILSSTSKCESKNPASYLSPRKNCTNSPFNAPSLITAGNDGALCLWDLSSVTVSTGVPKLIFNNKTLHTSGIFAMDTNLRNQALSRDTKLSKIENLLICTGSKDKTIAVSELKEMITNGDDSSCVMWKSAYHTGKVSSVAMRGIESSLLLSASDDGNIAIHDYKVNGTRIGSLASELKSVHTKPHSVEWDPLRQHEFLTGEHKFCIVNFK